MHSQVGEKRSMTTHKAIVPPGADSPQSSADMHSWSGVRAVRPPCRDRVEARGWSVCVRGWGSRIEIVCLLAQSSCRLTIHKRRDRNVDPGQNLEDARSGELDPD